MSVPSDEQDLQFQPDGAEGDEQFMERSYGEQEDEEYGPDDSPRTRREESLIDMETEEHQLEYYKEEKPKGRPKQPQNDHQQYDLDVSFERDPDLLTKVKAKLMFSINKERQINKLPLLCQNITLTTIAMQYASSLKSSTTPDPAYLKRLQEQERLDVPDINVCEIVSAYEEDIQVTKGYTEQFFLETNFLFFEMDKEKMYILDPTNNQIGIGLAGNESAISVVLLLGYKDMALTSVIEVAPNQIEVRGKMLEPNLGLLGVRVYNSIDTKEMAAFVFDKIDFDRATQQFCVEMEFQPNWKERRWLQFWTVSNPGSIQYKRPRKEKEKERNIFRNEKSRSKFLFVPFPDPLYIQCYNDAVMEEQKINKGVSSAILDALHINNPSQVYAQEHPPQTQEADQDPQDSQHNEDQDDEKGSDGQEDVGQSEANGAERQKMASHKEIKEQLESAVVDARNTHQTMLETNRQLQHKIKQAREKYRLDIDKTGEAPMNEHKYLNILAQVHQTRVDLQQTTDRYNMMSTELQKKLNSKQNKCTEIRNAFQALKREIARKATYSRSQQPIKQSKIDEWERRDAEVAVELKELRLEILRAKNSHAKNLKILKKKEELAEGLHLIDFEQLKIENQTLNEKIEERNEDLHKLKKKTTTMVQILTHTREKLVFVEKLKSSLLQAIGGLDQQIKGIRDQINELKAIGEGFRNQIQLAKQKTQIVNSQELVVDFKKRAQNNEKLRSQINALLEQQNQMKTVIEMYQRKVKKEAIGK